MMHRWLVTRMLPNRGLARPARLNGRKSISAPCAKEGLTCICVLLLPDAIFVFQTRESAPQGPRSGLGAEPEVEEQRFLTGSVEVQKSFS